MGELAGVLGLDGRVIGEGTAGPLAQPLAALFGEETRTAGEVV